MNLEKYKSLKEVARAYYFGEIKGNADQISVNFMELKYPNRKDTFTCIGTFQQYLDKIRREEYVESQLK
jgi:hypothetical protein